MLVAAGLAAVNFVYAVAALKEPPTHRPATGERVRIRVLASPRVRNLCATYFLFTFAVTQLETVFAYFMKDSFGYDVPQVAWILVLMAFVMASIQGGAIRRLVARHGEMRLVFFGITLMGVSFATIPWPGALGILLVPLVGSAVGRAVSHPSLLGLVSFEATHATRGAVMGVFQASASAARVVGPLAAGALYDWERTAPFMLAGLLMVVALGTASALRQRPAELDGEGRG
jgi:predicted MFS family arabinose efflux permease